MKKRRVVLLVLLSVLAVAAISGFVLKTTIENNLNQLASSAVPDVDLAAIDDGTYSGSYKEFPVSAKVEVTVKDHHITAIDIVEHKSGQGKPAEVIIDQVIEAQSLDVDIVSGATYSSKVILMAIEKALNGVE